MALLDSLPATREAWHRLAEHVLAAAQYAATDHIGLVPAPGGFASPSKIDRARSQHPTERGAHHRLADRADTDVQHWAVSGVHPGSSYLASEPIRPPQRLMPHRASRWVPPCAGMPPSSAGSASSGSDSRSPACTCISGACTPSTGRSLDPFVWSVRRERDGEQPDPGQVKPQPALAAGVAQYHTGAVGAAHYQGGGVGVERVCGQRRAVAAPDAGGHGYRQVHGEQLGASPCPGCAATVAAGTAWT